MSAWQEVEQRLRSACPEVNVPAPPLAFTLAYLECAIGAGAAPERPRRRWRRSGVIGPLLIAAAVLAGAGGGALLLLPGKPLAPAYVLPANPETGLGRPLAASVTPLPLRAPDPEGGPAWGMRVIRTTRGLVCLQAGRIVDGQLGGLGSGYAFSADGRFHPFLPEDAIATDACPAVGSDGLAFLPGPPVIATANALPLAGENVAPGDRVHCDLPGEEDWGVRCPQAELRQVAVGLLPGAASIEVETPGGSFTIKPYGPEGAYLIVLPAQPAVNASMSSGSFQGPFGSASSAPGGAVLRVTYGDGSRCQIPIATPQQQCHAQTTVAGGGALPSSGALASAVRVSYVARTSQQISPLLASARSSNRFSQRSFEPTRPGHEQAGPALTVSFRAPVSAANASTAYVVELRPQEVAGCATPSVIVSQPSEQTISAGQQVDMTVPLEDSCATSYSGRVFLAHSSSIGGESGGEGPLYEVIAARFGAGPGNNPMKFPTVGRFEVSVP